MSGISGNHSNPNVNLGTGTDKSLNKVVKNAENFRANDGNLNKDEMKELVKEGLELGTQFDVKSQKDVAKVIERLPAKMDPVAKGLVFQGLESKLAGHLSGELKKLSAQSEEGIAGKTMRSLVTNNPTIAKTVNFLGLTDRDASGEKATIRKEASEAQSKTENRVVEKKLDGEINKNRSARSLNCVSDSLKASGVPLNSQPPAGAIMSIKNLNKWTGKDWSVSKNGVTPEVKQKLQNWNGTPPVIELGAHVESFKGFDKEGNIKTASGKTINKADFADAKVYAPGKDALGKGSSEVEVMRGTHAHATTDVKFKGDKDEVATETLLHLAASPEPESQKAMAQVTKMARSGASADQVATYLKTVKPPVEFADKNKLTKMITLMATDVSPARPMTGPSGQVLKGADGNPKMFKNAFEYLSFVAKHDMSNIAREDIEKTDPDVIAKGAFSDGDIKEQGEYAMDMAKMLVCGGGGC